MKIGQRCPVHKGIYAGIARSFSSEPDNHIWLLDAKSTNELMNWADATEWAESLGEATGLPTRYEAVLLGCHLIEELGGNGYVWTSTSGEGQRAWRQHWDVSGPGYQCSVDVACTYRASAVKRLPVTHTV